MIKLSELNWIFDLKLTFFQIYGCHFNNYECHFAPQKSLKKTLVLRAAVKKVMAGTHIWVLYNVRLSKIYCLFILRYWSKSRPGQPRACMPKVGTRAHFYGTQDFIKRFWPVTQRHQPPYISICFCTRRP